MHFGRTEGVLSQALDAVALRQRVTADNIANVDTPGFKRTRVEFEALLSKYISPAKTRGVRLTTTNAKHFSLHTTSAIPRPQVYREVQTSLRNDGNNVDIEVEMAATLQNEIQYAALSQQLARRYAMLRTAVREGR